MDACYHIGFTQEHGAKYAILPGDPDRVEKIAAYLDGARPFAKRREYTSYLGELDGERVLVMSTGMGGPSTAIAVEELYRTGVRTFLRVGTAGGMKTEILGGDVVIATGAIRAEGTTREYVPVEFPAVADIGVTTALAQAAERLGYPHHTGVVHCKDSFYGQHDPERMPTGEELSYKWRAWIKAGCLASEMESATLFIVSHILGARAGAVFSVVWNQERARLGLANPECHDPSRAIRTAIEGLRTLIASDKG